MSEQLEIFPPFVRNSDTSKAAAESMVVSAASLRGQILKLFQTDVGRISGMTCDECEQYMHGRHQTISARIRELVQLGLISIALKPDGTERTRPTRSGRAARVYVVCTEATRAHLNRQASDDLGRPSDTTAEGG